MAAFVPNCSNVSASWPIKIQRQAVWLLSDPRDYLQVNSWQHNRQTRTAKLQMASNRHVTLSDDRHKMLQLQDRET